MGNLGNPVQHLPPSCHSCARHAAESRGRFYTSGSTADSLEISGRRRAIQGRYARYPWRWSNHDLLLQLLCSHSSLGIPASSRGCPIPGLWRVKYDATTFVYPGYSASKLRKAAQSQGTWQEAWQLNSETLRCRHGGEAFGLHRRRCHCRCLKRVCPARPCDSCGCGGQNRFGIPFWLVGEPPILVGFSGDWDVHWGYDLDFDPWPCVNWCEPHVAAAVRTPVCCSNMGSQTQLGSKLPWCTFCLGDASELLQLVASADLFADGTHPQLHLLKPNMSHKP